MIQEERLIVSAYTGVLMTDWDKVQEIHIPSVGQTCFHARVGF